MVLDIKLSKKIQTTYDIFEWLIDKHEKTDIPNSRIIEKALLEYYKDEIEEFRKSKEEKQQ